MVDVESKNSTSSLTVSFIGLGAMGKVMAKRLVESKKFAKVIVYNRTAKVAEPLEALGAVVAKTPKEAAAGSDIILTCVADDKALEAVMYAESGVLAGVSKPYVVHASMSTVSVDIIKKLVHDQAACAAASKVQFPLVSAPVFGRPPVAAAGMLGIVAAGDAEAIKFLEPAFSVLGKRTFLVGSGSTEPSLANVIKLSGNFMLMSAIEAMSEAFALTTKAGVDPALFYEVFSNTLFAGSPVHKGYGDLLVNRVWNQDDGFKAPLGLKDISLALRAAADLHVPMPQASQVRDNILTLLGREGPDIETVAIGKLALENAGLDGERKKKEEK